MVQEIFLGVRIGHPVPRVLASMGSTRVHLSKYLPSQGGGELQKAGKIAKDLIGCHILNFTRNKNRGRSRWFLCDICYQDSQAGCENKQDRVFELSALS